MKRVVASSLISLAILFVIAALFLYVQFRRIEDSRPIDAVPSDVAWIISTDPLSGELRMIAHSPLLRSISGMSEVDSLRQSILLLDSMGLNNPDMKRLFEKAPLLISGHPVGQNGFGLLFYVPVKKGIIPSVDGVISALMTSRVQAKSRRITDGVEVYDQQLENGKVFSWTISKGIFIGSFVPYLLEDAIRQQSSKEAVNSTGAVALYIEGVQRHTTFAVRYRGVSPWLTQHAGQSMSDAIHLVERVGEWSVMKLEWNDYLLQMNGQTLYADTFSFVKVFLDQRPVKQDLLGYLPSRAVAAVSWGMHDPAAFFTALKPALQESGSRSERDRQSFLRFMGTQLVFSVMESPDDSHGRAFLAICTLRDAVVCKQIMHELEGQEHGEEFYAGTSIRFVGQRALLEGVFGPLFSPMHKFFYCVVDDKLVMARQASILRAYLNEYRNGSLLRNQQDYIRLQQTVNPQGNIRFYADVNRSLGVLRELGAPEWMRWMEHYGSLTKELNKFMFTIGNTNGVFISEGSVTMGRNSGDNQLKRVGLPVTADSIALLMDCPGSKEWICVVDCTSTIRVYDYKGGLVWKRKLGSMPLSPWTIVDGDQGPLLVLMSDSLHVFNCEGKNVPGVPLKTRGGTSNSSVAVLSDSTGRSVGCAITTNGNPELYNFKGERIPGISGYRISSSSSFSLDSISGRVWTIGSANGFLMAEAGGKAWKNAWKSKLSGRGFISQVYGSDQPAFIAQSDSLIYLIGADGSCLPVFNGSTDKVLCAERVDVDRDGRSEWLIGDERGVRLQTNDGWTLFRYPTKRAVKSVKAIRRKETLCFMADDGGEVYVLNASGHLKCSSLAKNALFRLREYSTGLDFEVLEDDSVSIRALLN